MHRSCIPFGCLKVRLLTVYRLFLQNTDITLKRLQKASHICGNIPRPCFKAAVSLTELRQAEDVIRKAIQQLKDLFDVFCNRQLDGDMGQIIYRTFQVRPASSDDRFWESCLVEPVSPWAFSEMLKELCKQRHILPYD